jgi:ankyrin repeat protein
MLEDSIIDDERNKSDNDEKKLTSLPTVTPATAQFPDILQFLPVDEIKKQVEQYINNQEMLNKKGANGYAALHWACIRNDLNLIKYLINDCKAFVDIKGNLGETPLFICIK